MSRADIEQLDALISALRLRLDTPEPFQECKNLAVQIRGLPTRLDDLSAKIRSTVLNARATHDSPQVKQPQSEGDRADAPRPDLPDTLEAHRRSAIGDLDAAEATRLEFDDVRLEDCTVILYDLETTGVNSTSEAIVEIAAQRMHHTDGGWVREGEPLSLLVNPGKPIPAEATAIHHITDEMVAGARDISDALSELRYYIAMPGTRPTLVMAHNGMRFDRHFVRNAWSRVRPGVAFCPECVHYWGDTIPLFQVLEPGHAKYSLEQLYQDVGGPQTGAHRALADVRMMEVVLDTIWRRRAPDFDSRIERLADYHGLKDKGYQPRNSIFFPLS